jgi:hypothetical protein
VIFRLRKGEGEGERASRKAIQEGSADVRRIFLLVSAGLDERGVVAEAKSLASFEFRQDFLHSEIPKCAL